MRASEGIMGLTEQIYRRSRRPTASVTVNGQPVKPINAQGAITISQAFGQPIAGGSLRIVPPPFKVDLKQPVSIGWGYDGYQVPAFSGWVTDVSFTSYPRSVTLQIQDQLWLADFPTQKEEIFLGNNKRAKVVIQTLLSQYGGIGSINIPELEIRPGVPWVLGQLTPIAWTNTTPLQAATSICAVLGYWLYCDPTGTVRAVKISGAPSSNTFRSFDSADDLLIEGAPTRQQQFGGFYNKVVVYGANTGVQGAQLKVVWQVAHSLLPSGVFRETSFSSSLIEYENEEEGGWASATGVAKRLIGEYSRHPDVIRMRVKADPRLRVGMSVGIKDPRIGFPSQKAFFCYGIQSTFGGGDFSMQLTLDGGQGAQGNTTLLPPEAAFTWTIAFEVLEGVQYAEVFLDGSGSFSPVGQEVVEWTWTDTIGQTATGVKAALLYPMPPNAQAVITLKVRDTSSKINTLTQTVDLTQNPLDKKQIHREISFAAGPTWYVTPDGGATWNSELGQATTAVPPISGYGSALTPQATAEAIGFVANGGASGNATRSTTTFLTTPSTALGVLPGPVAFLWQNEADPLRLWAAVGAQVYRSIDGGVSWELAGSPNGQPVTWVLEAASQLGAVEALAGNAALWSTNGGAGFSAVLTGPSGAVARCYTSGFERHWVGFTGVVAGESPLRAVEGPQVTFPPDASPPVTDIRAVTMLIDEPTLYAFDAQGRIWKADVTAGGLAEFITLTGAQPAFAPNHAIRTPTERVILVSTDAALCKFFPDTKTCMVFKRVAEGGAEKGYMAGYGGPGNRLKVKANIVQMSTNAPGTHDGCWFFNAALQVWERRNGPVGTSAALPNYKTWLGVEIDPANPNRWLAYAPDCAYITEDLGLTWQPLDIHPVSPPGFEGGETRPFYIVGATFAAEGGRWLVWGEEYEGFLGGDWTTIWSGIGTATDATRIDGVNGAYQMTRPRPWAWVQPGAGEFVGSERRQGGRFTPEGGGVWSLKVGTGDDEPSGGGERGGAGGGGSPDVPNYTTTGLVTSYDKLHDFIPGNFITESYGVAGSLALVGVLQAAGNPTYPGDVLATANYRSSIPTTRVGGTGGTTVAVAGGAVYVGGRYGLVKIVNIMTAPVDSVIDGTSTWNMGWVRSDPLTQSVAVARINAKGVAPANVPSRNFFVSLDGLAWQEIPGPPGIDPSWMAGRFGVAGTVE